MSRLSTNIHPMLNDITINNLCNKNIFTTIQFIETEIKQLATITGLTYKNVLLLRRHIINKNSAVTRNGLEYYVQLTTNAAIIPTGINAIDELLEGGLVTGNIYELCGLPSSGKTQFCLTLAMNAGKNLCHYVYYLETKGDFSSTRVKCMLDKDKINEVNTANILTKILVKHLTSQYQLLNSLYDIKEEIRNGLKIRLIIIDSFPPLFYQYSDIAKCCGVLNLIVNLMHLLSMEYYVTFVVTNILTTWYDGNFREEGMLREKIGCGKYWLSVPNTRLKISRATEGPEEVYNISVLKTNKLFKTNICKVTIQDSGMM